MGDAPNEDFQKELTKVDRDIRSGNWASAYPEIEKVAVTQKGRDLFNAHFKDMPGVLPQLQLIWGKDKDRLKSFDTNNNGLEADEIQKALDPSTTTSGIDRLVMGQLNDNFGRVAKRDGNEATITPADLVSNKQAHTPGVRDWHNGNKLFYVGQGHDVSAMRYEHTNAAGTRNTYYDRALDDSGNPKLDGRGVPLWTTYQAKDTKGKPVNPQEVAFTPYVDPKTGKFSDADRINAPKMPGRTAVFDWDLNRFVCVNPNAKIYGLHDQRYNAPKTADAVARESAKTTEQSPKTSDGAINTKTNVLGTTIETDKDGDVTHLRFVKGVEIKNVKYDATKDKDDHKQLLGYDLVKDGRVITWSRTKPGETFTAKDARGKTIGEAKDIKLYANGNVSYSDKLKGDVIVRGNGTELLTGKGKPSYSFDDQGRFTEIAGYKTRKFEYSGNSSEPSKVIVNNPHSNPELTFTHEFRPDTKDWSCKDNNGKVWNATQGVHHLDQSTGAYTIENKVGQQNNPTAIFETLYPNGRTEFHQLFLHPNDITTDRQFNGQGHFIGEHTTGPEKKATNELRHAWRALNPETKDRPIVRPREVKASNGGISRPGVAVPPPIISRPQPTQPRDNKPATVLPNAEPTRARESSQARPARTNAPDSSGKSEPVPLLEPIPGPSNKSTSTFFHLDGYMLPSPDQLGGGNCLYMSGTGIAEWLLNKSAGITNPQVGGPTDLSEQWTIEASKRFGLNNNYTDVVDLLYSAGLVRDANMPFSSYRDQSWISSPVRSTNEGNISRNLPPYNKHVLYSAGGEGTQRSNGVMSLTDVENIKTFLRTHESPVLFVFKPEGVNYWHANIITGFDDKRQTFTMRDSSFGNPVQSIAPYNYDGQSGSKPYRGEFEMSYHNAARWGNHATGYTLVTRTGTQLTRR